MFWGYPTFASDDHQNHLCMGHARMLSLSVVSKLKRNYFSLRNLECVFKVAQCIWIPPGKIADLYFFSCPS